MYSKNHPRKGKVVGAKWKLGEAFQPQNFIPGVVIGFIAGMLLDLANINFNKYNHNNNKPSKAKGRSFVPGTGTHPLLDKLEKTHQGVSSSDQELKMVLVVRQDLRMGPGKIASQCARKIHIDLNSDAATGLYSELIQSQRSLLRKWEHYGQPKIVVTCKNQKEMNRLQEEAEGIGLPTFVVADAGRTQVAAGSQTVLAIGPGAKVYVDSVTGKQRLL